METGLEDKPWYVAAAVAAALLVGIYFGIDYFFVKGMRQNIERQQSRYDDLQAEIQEARTAEANLPQFREEVRRLELELDKLLRILPARRNTEDLLRRIRALTEQGDFNLVAFDPGSPQPLDFYSEWPIRVELQGTYHNLALFFDRVSQFRRIINIDGLDVNALAAKEDSYHTIRATFTAKTFLYNPPEEEDEEMTE